MPIPTLVSSYENEQFHIRTDDLNNIKGESESGEEHRERMKDTYSEHLSYVSGYSTTPWSKSFNDLAATVKGIPQPWWAGKHEPYMSKMTAKECHEIGWRTENVETRITEPLDEELKRNIEEM